MARRSHVAVAVALAMVLGAAALVLAVARARYAPPAPRDERAPAADFSAIRAKAALARALGDGAPHPAGSPAEARVRARIVGELAALGYAPRVVHGFSCSRYGTCADVQNVVAELAGARDDAVLVSAHYDSVPAAGGANDDGAGVAAALEIARALKASAPPARSVLFLFDDAEEEGLLGALAFSRSPDAARVRAAVNVDARGGRGPATIFETSAGSAAVIALVARVVPRPVTSSLFFAVYQRMPNDTDFTVLKRGARGANIAYLGDIQRYHTPLDTLDALDPGTLQQAGDAELALARALAASNAAPAGQAVWFDVLAAFVVRYPEWLAFPLAALALALVVLATWALARAYDASLLGVLAGVGAIPGAVLAAALVIAFGVMRALDALGAVGAPFTANAAWVLGAAWLAGAGAACAASAILRAGWLGAWGGGWIFLAGLGAIVAAVVPGASYLAVVPALAAGLTGLLVARAARACEGRFAAALPALATALPALVALVVLAPVALLSYDAMGLIAAPGAGALGALLVTLVAAPLLAELPVRARAAFPVALFAGCVASALVAARAAPFTARVPARANVVFAQDDARARVTIDPAWGGRAWGPIAPEMRAALGDGARFEAGKPFADARVLAADAPRIDAPPPEALDVAATPPLDGRRRISLRVRSPRGARALSIELPRDARVTRVAGADPQPPAVSTLRLFAVPDEGVRLDIDAPAEPIDVILLDETATLPASAATVVAARPSWTTPTQQGDVTRVARHLTL